jgi:hypothetical protein
MPPAAKTVAASRRPSTFAGLPEDIHATWLAFAGLPEIRQAWARPTVDAEPLGDDGGDLQASHSELPLVRFHRDGNGAEYLVHAQQAVMAKAMGDEIAGAVVALNAVECGAMHRRWLEFRLLCRRVCTAVDVNVRETMAIDGVFRDMAAHQRRCEANAGLVPLQHLGLKQDVDTSCVEGHTEQNQGSTPQQLLRRALQQQPPAISNPFSVRRTDAMPGPPFLVQPAGTERALCAFLDATSAAAPANIRALLACLLPQDGGGGALGWPRGSPLGAVVQQWLADSGTIDASERLVDVFDCAEAEWTPEETCAAAELAEQRIMRRFVQSMRHSAANDAEASATAEKEDQALLSKRPEHKGVHEYGGDAGGDAFAHRAVDLVANEALFVFATASAPLRQPQNAEDEHAQLPEGAVECLPPHVRRLLARHIAIVVLSDANPLMQLDVPATRPALATAFHPGSRSSAQQTLPDLTRAHDALLLPLPWPGFVIIMRDASTLRWSWGSSMVGLGSVSTGVATAVFPPSVTRIAPRCFMAAADLNTIDLTRCVNLKSFGDNFANHSGFEKLLLPPFRQVPGVEKLDAHFIEHSFRVSTIDLRSLVCLSTIKQHAFADCRALHTLRLPGSVRHIQKYFCANCTSLRRLDLGHLHALQQIGTKAFDGVPRVHLTLSPRASGVETWSLPRHSVFVLVADAVDFHASGGDSEEDTAGVADAPAQQQQPQLRADSEVWEEW